MTPTEIDALLAAEQYRKALSSIELTLAAEPDASTRWRLQLRRARLSLLMGEEAADELILLAGDLLVDDCTDRAEVAAELPLVHALIIRGYARKRCQDLAGQAVAAAREAVGEALDVLVAEGGCAMTFDEREAARELYERALELYPGEGAAHLAMANLAYVVGDFDDALAHQQQLDEGGLHWARGVRLRGTVHAARHEFDAEAEQWLLLLERVPDGDWAVTDRLALALALVAAGRRDEAMEQFRTAWRDEPDSGEGQYARERMEFLEAAGEDTA